MDIDIEALGVFLGAIVQITGAYLFLGLVCSLFTEIFSSVRAERAKTLNNTLEKLLGSEYINAFYEHPLIKPLGQYLPYLSPWLFSITVLDILGINNVTEYAAKQNNEVKLQNNLDKAIRVLMNHESNNHQATRQSLEKWFLETVYRAAGRYKRRILFYNLIFSTVLVAATNFDTIAMLETLQVGFSFGWSGVPDGFGEWSRKILGLFLSTVSIAFSASVAFNYINEKFSSLRTSEAKTSIRYPSSKTDKA